MQVFLTIVAGVMVYIIGQAILHFVFEPIKEFNKQRTDTSFLLLFQQARITNALNPDKKVSDDIKEMGAALISSMGQIPCYQFLSWLNVFGLPHKQSVFEAARELNGVAFTIGPGESHGDSAARNVKALEMIARLLKIQTGYS
jgi:hypothetical protein